MAASESQKVNTGYSDIINLPHYEPRFHPRMRREDRAAQFSPFAALTGYDEKISESARLTDKKIELSEDAKSLINAELQALVDIKDTFPSITVTYFLPDMRKEGGVYVSKTAEFLAVDEYRRSIVFTDKTEVPIDAVVDIIKNAKPCASHNEELEIKNQE